jgi:coproporphyrinogen III oxidase-like Fe-S oxidoreductase
MSQENLLPMPFPWTPAQISMDAIDLKTQMSDFMMVGLRLVEEGVSERRFRKLFGSSMTEIFSQEITTLIGQGLIEWSDGEERKLHLTRRGIFLANQVFMAFV